MDIRGLRLGNLIYGNSIHKNEIVKVKSITETGFSYDALNVHNQTYEAFCSYEKLKAIKITENILVSLGAYWEDVLDEKDALVIDITENISIGWCGYLFLIVNDCVIQINNANSEYIHQLQNVYADLSGKELNVNL